MIGKTFGAISNIVLPAVVLHIVGLPVALMLGAPESESAKIVGITVGLIAAGAAWYWTRLGGFMKD